MSDKANGAQDSKAEKPRKRPQAWTAKTEALFLAGLAKRASVEDGLKAANVVRRTVELRRQSDAAFAAAYDEALSAARDRAMVELYRRGFEGWDEPVYRGKDMVGTIRKHDTSAAGLWTREYAPEMWHTVHTGKGGEAITIRCVE